MMMQSISFDQQLEQLNHSNIPFALYCFNQHGTSSPKVMLLTDLEKQVYLKSLMMLNKHLQSVSVNQSPVHLACTLNYEAGYKMEKKLSALVPSPTHLGWLGWFKQARHASYQEFKSWINKQRIKNRKWPDYWLGECEPLISYEDYNKTVGVIKSYIASGDTYQVNYTFPLSAAWIGNAYTFFADLFHNQPVGYAALIRHQQGLVLSLSPELFFSKQGSQIITKPMKGTARRALEPDHDKKIKHGLQLSKKDRAENLMIVDLLRNDLGRICQTGTIKTKALFHIEKYKTIYQMTSTVTGKLKPTTTWPALFKALFPCGSVTGAPKVRTMEIIKKLEPNARDLYTGACGYIEPNGDGQFNVPIRSLEINTNTHKLRCGIGSGITIDSNAGSEWQESHDKSQFLVKLSQTYQLIETLRWSPQAGWLYLNQHLKRMAASAKVFKINFNELEITTELKKVVKRISKPADHRVRLLLFVDGQFSVEVTPITDNQKPHKNIVRLANVHVDSTNLFLYHKTSNRHLYNNYYERAKREKITDYIFTNESGHLTEGTISNLFIVKNGQWLTPPIQDGLLPGVMRQVVIKQKKAKEKSLTSDELKQADQLFISNGVKGLIQVNFLK